MDLEDMVYKAVREKVWEKVEEMAKEPAFKELLEQAVRENLEKDDLDVLIEDVLRENEGWHEVIENEASRVLKNHMQGGNGND